MTRLEYEHALPPLQDALLEAQFQLKQRRDRAVVLVVTGIPAAGRSEVVNELLEWLDPKLVSTHGFRLPSEVERERPPLWRYWRLLPPKGRVAILHAGWYQELLHEAVRLDGPRRALPRELRRAVDRIRQLERMLVSDGVAVAKVHLHVASQTQRKRLDKLEADKATRWRVTREDRWMARHYDEVGRAMERCIDATEQHAAPWQLVDGTDAQHRALAVGRRLLEAIREPLPGTTRTRTARAAARRIVALPSAAPGERPDDDEYERELERLQGRLALLTRRRRFARYSVVAAFEGMDAAGKGGAIRRITAALDARQYRVVPISAPTPDQLARPYLWRFWCQAPPRGNLTIFDRSWYGRVLVERVRKFAPPPDWRRAYDEIVEFERQLHEHRVIVAKFWLSVGREEQLERFGERDRSPLKRFKVDPEDWENRKHWNAYQAAAREMIARTHSSHAPWTVVPADDKRRARLQVLASLCDSVELALDGAAAARRSP